jgi:hypothetical protein
VEVAIIVLHDNGGHLLRRQVLPVRILALHVRAIV